MPFTLLASLLSGLPGAIGSYFQKQRDLGMAEIDLKQAELDAKIEIAKVETTAELDIRTEELRATSSGFKQTVFWFFSSIVVYSILLPSHAQILWNNLGIVPEWFRTMYAAMVCAIWGIPIASKFVSNIFSGIGGAMSSSRDHEINKIHALNESILAEDLRKTIFKNGMSQTQWNAIVQAYNDANGSNV